MTEMVISDVAEIKIMIPKMNAIAYIPTSTNELLILTVLRMSITQFNISNTQTIPLISTDPCEY